MSIPDFRDLYKNLLNYGFEAENLYQEVLLPWHDKADLAMRHLKAYGNVEAPNWRKKDRWRIQDLYAFYALSRVSNILLLPFQTGSYDIKHAPRISLEERSEYFIQLGMQPIKQTTFHPFFHEIVEVVQSLESSAPISLIEII